MILTFGLRLPQKQSVDLHDIFKWGGYGQRKKGIYFGKDSNRILDEKIF